MEIQLLVFAFHGLLTLLVVVSFLCGQWPIFQGTPIHRLHLFLTFGAYDCFLKFVGYACGDRGTSTILSVERFCCDRPNPILQIIYLMIVGVTYYLVAESSFDNIPSYYLSEAHIYISVLAVGVGVLLFLLTSFSDPGTVTVDNVSAYIDAYPYDNIIYTEKECSTCNFLKPARSKHCSICDRCVARFDHHCGWMNNCIGERNTRYFLAFLLWHFLLCIYGTVVISLLVVGRLKELRIIHILTVYYGVDNTYRSLAPHIVQWLLSSYNTHILLIVFLAIISLLLSGFFFYHANLCLTNTTTNETFKWQEYISWQKKVYEARALKASLKAKNLGEVSSENIDVKTEKLSQGAAKRNVYDQGVLHNLREVIFPPSGRLSFLSKKMKSG